MSDNKLNLENLSGGKDDSKSGIKPIFHLKSPILFPQKRKSRIFHLKNQSLKQKIAQML